jgi:hypothetical protein
LAPGAFHRDSLSGISPAPPRIPQAERSPRSRWPKPLPFGTTLTTAGRFHDDLRRLASYGDPAGVEPAPLPACVKVPGFCCHAPGGAESRSGGLQVTSIVGSYCVCSAYGGSPLGLSDSESMRCRNQVAPIRCALLPASWQSAAGVEPAAEPSGPVVATATPRSQDASGGGGGNRTRVQRTSSSSSRSFRTAQPSHCRPTKAQGELIGGLPGTRTPLPFGPQIYSLLRSPAPPAIHSLWSTLNITA